MANPSNRHPQNVPGRYYVDTECRMCTNCIDYAPEHFACDDAAETYYVTRQPVNAEETARCEAAMESCPHGAIGNDG